MTSIQYLEKLRSKSTHSLEYAKKRNATSEEISNIEEQLRCQEVVIDILKKNENIENYSGICKYCGAKFKNKGYVCSECSKKLHMIREIQDMLIPLYVKKYGKKPRCCDDRRK